VNGVGMDDVAQANIILHSKMADTYNEREPHFRPENKEKVRNKLQEIHSVSGGKLLDVGCGTGFIIDLSKDLFDVVYGVDITEAMLKKVDVSSGNINLLNVNAESMPFEDNYFDVVTAYSFLHHLKDYTGVLNEVYRVLKKGGIFYIDLEPNKLFWEMAQQYKSVEYSQYSDIIKREIKSICFTAESVYEEYGIDKDIFNKAEYIKSVFGGIDADQFESNIYNIGFSNCMTKYQWYAGQGKVLHKQSEKDAKIIEDYLIEILPFSNSLFKYLQFIIVK